VKLVSGGEVTGRVVDAGSDGVRIAIAASKPGGAPSEKRFGFDELGPGRVQVEFNRPGPAGDADATDADLELQHEESR
jgi:ribosome maturation factor RimP